MIVPTPTELDWGWHGVDRPALSNGSAHALEMTEKQTERAKRRKKKRAPFGFTIPPTEGDST